MHKSRLDLNPEITESNETYSVTDVIAHSLISSPTGEYLGCFQFGDITNKAAVNICVQIFVGAYAVILFGKCLGCKMAGLHVSLCLIS